MKRVADKQLIKDGRDEDEDEEVGLGFKKADESALARRQIRGLPKRSLAGIAGVDAAAPSPAGFSWNSGVPAVPAATTSEQEAAPASKFAGFSGFGTSSTTVATNSLALGGSSTPFGHSFGQTVPTTTAGASKPARVFASFLGSGVTTNGVDNKPTLAPAIPSLSVSSTSAEDKHALHYFTSLRGLNISLVDAVNKYMEEDAFVDLSVFLEQYKSKRTDVQKEFDSKKSSLTKPSGAPAAPPKLNPPLASGSPFAPPPISSNSTDSKPATLGGGFSFTPKPVPLSGKTPSFTLPPSTESKSSESKPILGGFSLGGTTTTTPSTLGGFSFGGAPKETNSSSAPSMGGFSFGAPAKDASSSSTPSSSGFNFGAPAKDAAPTPSGFSFGGPTKESSTLTGFSFGAPSKAEASSSPSLPFSLTSTSSSAPKPFSFGGDKPKGENINKEEVKPAAVSSGLIGVTSSSPSASSPFGSFGKPASTSGFSFGSGSPSSGSELKPFGFGAGPSTPSVFGSAPKGSGFSFGGAAGSAATNKDDEGEDMKVEARNTASDGAPSAAAMLGVNPHDEEGEGEEDEETIHAIKSKVYRMKKADEKGGAGWVEAGHGVMRLKKHKETGVRRMLLRNSTTGKININFALYSGLAPKQSKKTVTFIGHDNSVAQTYNARVPSEDAARELKEALEREVALIKATDSE